MPGLPFKIIYPQWLHTRLHSIRRLAPPLNFITLHYAYFLLTTLISAVILWGSSTPPRSLSFVDALFLTVSAMSCAGLNTVNLSELNSFQQVILFVLIMLGSVILVSAVVVYIRRAAFEKHFSHIVLQQQKENVHKKRRLSHNDRAGQAKKSSTQTPRENRAATLRSVVTTQSPIENKGGNSPGIRRAEQIFLVADAQDDAYNDGGVGQVRESAVNDISIEHNEKDRRDDDPLPTSPSLRFTNQEHQRRHHRVFSFSGVGARPDLSNHPRSARPYATPWPMDLEAEPDGWPKESSPTDTQSRSRIGRNSQFSSMTMAERVKLGGVEYRALKVLQIVVPLYYVLFQLFGCIGLGAWVSINAAEIAQNNGLSPWWVGAFNAVSAFNNSGMSLLDANMVAFQWSYYMMITMGMLILAGNTCYPVILRLIFWCLWRWTPSSDPWKDTKVALRFILDHPRRVYTNLFPSSHTWFLLGTVITLNAIDWLGFEILNIGNPYVESLPPKLRVIDGLFQATAVRSGGFYVVPIANIAISVQVLYVLMMYISVYPVTMTMRNSNVYEERSLGIYAGDQSYAEEPLSHEKQPENMSGLFRPFRQSLTNQKLYAETGTYSRSYFVRQQLRSQLAHDLWWVCLAVLLIMIIEGGQFAADPVAYSVFNVVFEVVSGYGTVGISVGLPNEAYSFCGGWHSLSKLILCAVMLRGRHRGLPVAIDRAVLLPDEHLADAEEEDARLRAEPMAERTNMSPDRPLSAGILRSRAMSSRSDHIV